MIRCSLFSIALLTLAGFAMAEASKHSGLSAVPFTEVRLSDEFWTPRLEINREKSLPHNFEWCEKTGRIGNFAKAGKLMEGKFQGHYFNDSDVYKMLEGASYSLTIHPDPKLEKAVDDVIAKIAAAQQPDGYLYTFHTLKDPGKRWTNLRNGHELYCAGHLIEAAVAHFRATGKRTFLDVAVKCADCINGVFGPTKRHGVGGHEEIELALVKLYQVTGQRKYLELAKFFIDIRGERSRRDALYGTHYQDHLPVRQQSEIVGHAVRAMYLCAGATDVAAHTGDQSLVDAMGRLWQDVVRRKMYITGGIGARHKGEAFGDAYELPNESAYCETCAAIGVAFWAHRMNLMHADAQFADVVERVLYNGILSGIGMDGKHFFYVNPLAGDGKHHRQPFFTCACCPTNVVRFIPSLPGYVYAVGKSGGTDEIYVNLFVAGEASVPLGGNKVRLTQQTLYPWDGKTLLTVEPEKSERFALCLRIPAWCKGATLAVNGKPAAPLNVEKGYARLERKWRPGDAVELELPMPIERIEANPRVEADRGRVAVRRGPVVYCFEAVDNGGSVKDIVLPVDPKFTAEYRDDLLGGVTVIAGVAKDGRKITAVPYHVWDHREPGEMIVWVRQDGKSPNPSTDEPSWKGTLYRPLDSGGAVLFEMIGPGKNVTVHGGLSQFSRREGGCLGKSLDRRENGTVPLAPRCVLLCATVCFSAAEDPRNVRCGSVIPDEGYCDQPYVVVTKDGNWLCTLTTGAGHEGTKGQHVVSTISTDKGKTWSELVDIEPSSGPEASWVTPLIVPGGRVYAFYSYNGDKIRTLPGKKKGCRTDMLGWYCFKYSDDGGKSWSAERYRLPVQVTACDLANNWGGKVQIFWGIDKPKVSDGCAIFAFTKLGRYMLDNGEGWLFRSDNILTETDPSKLHWTLLPDGEHGIRAPEFGSVQEEHNIVPLGDNKLYCVYRTTTGYPCHTYSSDGGHTWTKPVHMTYTSGGRKIKTPRACPKLWRTADGRFLFWFHNHGGHGFSSRNPAWIVGGVEKNGRIQWSQPEILLYDPVADTRMSYPDLIEQDGRFWITETQKTVARVHEIDKTLFEGLWRQGQVKTVARKGLVLQRRFGPGDAKNCNIPYGINLSETGGLTLDCWMQLDDLTPGQTILDSRDSNGKGVVLSTVKDGAVRLEFSDGKTTAAWDCDPGLLQAGKLHHVAAIADAGPRIITFVVDGVLCDGSRHRQYGWGRWRGELDTVLEAGPLAVGQSLKSLRVYDRYLRTSEAIGNFQAGASEK